MSKELRETFLAFANHGKGSGVHKTEMDNTAWVKCCKDGKVIDGKKVTSTDADIVFSKFKTKSARTITFDQFQVCLEELAKKRCDGNVDEILAMISGRSPQLKGITTTPKTGVVTRMTDTSKYTGTHKERFDETGKGKGIEGRKNLVEDTGYVGSYKGQGTYESKVGK